MIGVKTGIRPEEVRSEGQHVLFIEGSEESFDIKVLNQLLDDKVIIEPLGPCYSIQNVANSLFRFHPTYYFLIDRDHHDDYFVESCWSNFPNPDTSNLLVWRRKEIENYFLDPSYLFQSSFCKVSEEEIIKTVLKYANERLFLDIANQVVTSIREELKHTWIKISSNPSDFSSKEIALNALKSANEFEQYRADVDQKVSEDEIEQRFHNFFDNMTGGEEQLVFDSGKWLSIIGGKKILSQVINSSCFSVKTSDGKILTGIEKMNEVVKDLLRKDFSIQPQDFVMLKQLIDKRVGRFS